MKRKLTPEQRQERLTRREKARHVAAEKVTVLREWHQARVAAAEKRAENRRQARQDQKPVEGGPTVEPYLQSKHGTKLAQPEDLHPAGNHAMRRARGQRGHTRKPRRRELPGSVERRIQRRQKEWLS